MEEAVECGGSPGLVARRDRLHRGDLREGREAHVRQGRQSLGSSTPFQFQSGREHAKGNRHSRGGEGQRARVQDAREGCGGPEWRRIEETINRNEQSEVEGQGHIAPQQPTEVA
jgi:hypothetical protein